MDTITSIEVLEELYDDAVPAALAKVCDHLTPLYRQWIEASRFLILSTVGPDGTDASPRGDDGPVVQIKDTKTLLLPDWRGNNRLDSLRNIVMDGRVSLMFMVPGCDNVVRINAHAQLTADKAICAAFKKNGKQPHTVIVMQVHEVYFQCAKALMRSKLWAGGDESTSVPTAGAFIREMQQGFDADSYDTNYAKEAQAKMW